MNVKTDLNINGLKGALKERGIKILGKKNNAIVIDASNGVFLEGVLPPGKIRKRKRVIRFSKNENDFIDPTVFGFIARLAEKGLKILIQPLPKKKSGDSKKVSFFFEGRQARDGERKSNHYSTGS